MTLACTHLNELPEVAKQLVAKWSTPQIVVVDGPMGAGKTTLISEICRILGSIDDVSSPTFSLVNEYHTDSGESIFHFDLYRIEDESEAMDIGIEEYFSSGNFCFIEWSERIPNLLPETFSRVDIKMDDGKRIFSFS